MAARLVWTIVLISVSLLPACEEVSPAVDPQPGVEESPEPVEEPVAMPVEEELAAPEEPAEEQPTAPEPPPVQQPPEPVIPAESEAEPSNGGGYIFQE